ncbi:hypothetical protein CEQ90_11515 [Lewinellaceae bacterium SD302]|nr:hypothetical protein CEQ90_11515 [Lewinellaceae bacterium SD302]
MQARSIANPINDLREIRGLMERSRYFIGLSGLSGIGAGICALLGVATVMAYRFVGGYYVVFFSYGRGYSENHPWGIQPLPFIALTGILTLLGALLCGFYFTSRRAKAHGQELFHTKAYQLLFHLCVPLVVGGVFSLALLYHQHGGLIAPITLIFYGLALINGSRYAREELSYLGYMEVVLGLISAFFIGYGLYFWAVGFGFLHIAYGVWMYQKYDRA